VTRRPLRAERVAELFPLRNRSFTVTMAASGGRENSYFECCTECGSLVASTHTARHVDFHDRGQEP